MKPLFRDNAVFPHFLWPSWCRNLCNCLQLMRNEYSLRAPPRTIPIILRAVMSPLTFETPKYHALASDQIELLMEYIQKLHPKLTASSGFHGPARSLGSSFLGYYLRPAGCDAGVFA